MPRRRLLLGLLRLLMNCLLLRLLLGLLRLLLHCLLRAVLLRAARRCCRHLVDCGRVSVEAVCEYKEDTPLRCNLAILHAMQCFTRKKMY